MNPAPGKLTVRDWLQRPEEHGVQLIDGALVMEPSPNLYHQSVVLNICRLLDSHVRAHRLGKICVSPLDVYLSENDVLQPDVMFVANDNRALLQADGVHGGPDLVVEVLSPSTARLDAGRKLELYRRHGVKEIWLVDPAARQIERYDSRDNPMRPVARIRDAETFSSMLLPGLIIPVAEIFQT